MGGTITAGNRGDRTGALFALTMPAAAEMTRMEEVVAS